MFLKDIPDTLDNVSNFQCATAFSTDSTNVLILTLDFKNIGIENE